MNARLNALHFIVDALREGGDFNTRFRDGCFEPLAWELVVQYANQHLLTPALWIRLQKRGMAPMLPNDLQDYLSGLHRLSTERNKALRRQTLEALEVLMEAGVDAVLLKGATYLFTEDFPDLAGRIMTDIDILIPADQRVRAREALQQTGYTAAADPATDYEMHRHLAPMIRPGEYAAIEIHTGLLPDHLTTLLPAESVWGLLETLPTFQVPVRVLAPAPRVLVNFAHAQLVDRGHGKGVIPLRSLFETCCVIRRQRENVDWDWLQGRIREGGQKDAYDAYLQLLADLFGETADRWQPTRRSRLHALRCRAQWRWPAVARCGESIHRYFGRESLRRQGLPADTVAATWVSRARNLPSFLHSTLTGSGRRKWLAKMQTAEPPGEES